jgi:hypothetical protein
MDNQLLNCAIDKNVVFCNLNKVGNIIICEYAMENTYV